MTVQFRDDDTQQTAQSYALGYDALMRDDYAAAIDAFYAVVTCDPTSRVGWLGLGVSLRCNCTFETAQQVFALLLSRNPPRSGRVDISGRNPAAIGGHGAGAGLSATGDQPVGAQGSASVTTHDRRLERAVVLSWTARMMTPTTLMNIIRTTGSTSVANDVADLRLAQNLQTATPAPAVRQGAQ